MDGIYLKMLCGGSYENVAVMVSIGADDDGYREIVGAAEGFTESAECWREFLSWLRSRGVSEAKVLAEADELESMRLGEAAKVVRCGYAETLA